MKYYKEAIKMDISDPNDIQSELAVAERMIKAKEKKRLENLSKAMNQALTNNELEKKPTSEEPKKEEEKNDENCKSS